MVPRDRHFGILVESPPSVDPHRTRVGRAGEHTIIEEADARELPRDIAHGIRLGYLAVREGEPKLIEAWREEVDPPAEDRAKRLATVLRVLDRVLRGVRALDAVRVCRCRGARGWPPISRRGPTTRALRFGPWGDLGTVAQGDSASGSSGGAPGHAAMCNRVQPPARTIDIRFHPLEDRPRRAVHDVQSYGFSRSFRRRPMSFTACSPAAEPAFITTRKIMSC